MHGKIRDEILRSAAVNDLGSYSWYVHGWKPQPHQEIWYRALTDVSKPKILLLCPPSHSKTNVMISYLGWEIGRATMKGVPIRCGYLSEAAKQAEKSSVAVRNTVEFEPKYREVFPGVKPDYKTGWGQEEWYVERNVTGVKDATLGAYGIDGAYQGSRWDIGVFDDLNSPQNTSTKAQMEKTNALVTGVALKRVEKGGLVRWIGTKWENGDSLEVAERAGFYIIHMPALGYWELVEKVNNVRKVEDSEQGAENVGVPAKNVGSEKKAKTRMAGVVKVGKGQVVEPVVVEQKKVEVSSGIFRSDLIVPSVEQVREAHDSGELDEGGALWLEQWPKDVLLEKRKLDPVRFEKTEMGFVGMSQGAVFERGWFGRFTMESVDWSKVLLVLQSWDTAYGGSVSADDSVCTTMLIYSTGHILIPSVVTGNWDQPGLEDRTKSEYVAWRPGVVLVEDIGSGKSMMQNLTGSTMIPFLAVRNKYRGEKSGISSAKAKRALAGSGLAKQGRVLLLEGADWVESWLWDMCKFPFGRKDDKVDSYAQAVDFVMDTQAEMMKVEVESRMGGVVVPGGERRELIEEDTVEVDFLSVAAGDWIQ